MHSIVPFPHRQCRPGKNSACSIEYQHRAGRTQKQQKQNKISVSKMIQNYYQTQGTLRAAEHRTKQGPFRAERIFISKAEIRENLSNPEGWSPPNQLRFVNPTPQTNNRAYNRPKNYAASIGYSLNHWKILHRVAHRQLLHGTKIAALRLLHSETKKANQRNSHKK